MIPKSWLPAARMKRVHLHWTAGLRTASSLDRKHYHLIVEGDTNLVRGDLPISANASPIRGNYAAHTLRANTDAIGVSLAGMAGAQESPWRPGGHPINRDQWEAGVRVIAELCRTYDIDVSPVTVLTHAEVQKALGIAQRGKWDIARLAFEPSVFGAEVVGDRLRNEVRAVLAGKRPERVIQEPVSAPVGAIPPMALRGVVTASWLRLRRAPAGEIIGGMPAGTPLTIVDHDRGWAEVITPGGYRGFAALNFIALD